MDLHDGATGDSVHRDAGVHGGEVGQRHVDAAVAVVGVRPAHVIGTAALQRVHVHVVDDGQFWKGVPASGWTNCWGRSVADCGVNVKDVELSLDVDPFNMM